MKNDLTPFERTLLRCLNVKLKSSYTHKNFMEWSNSKERIEKNLKDGEAMHDVLGYYISINPKN